MAGAVSRAFNIADLREQARRRLPRGIFEFIDRGSEDEGLLRRNREGFDRLRLVPRAAVDVSGRTTATSFMGREHAMPLAIGPTGAAGLLWHEGELALAKAAAAANIPFTLATGSMTGMEKIANEAGGRLWFQLYMWADREMSHQLVRRAKAAGFEGLVVTVDTPVLANREYNARNGFSLPFNVSPRAAAAMLARPGWLIGVLGRYLATTGLPRYENYPDGQQRRITQGGGRNPLMRCDSLTWDDISRLRELWDGTFIVKGLLNPLDGPRAFAAGADAIVLSNHGGRNLDAAMATIDLLPEFVAAAGPGRRILIDSGIRRGSDIAKALALGAHGVLLGRAPLYGVAAGGEAGVSRALAILRNELDTVMAMTGRASIADITADLVRFDPQASAPRAGAVQLDWPAVPGAEPRPFAAGRGAAPTAIHSTGAAS